MLVSLCNELVFISYQELDFQSNKDSRRSISRYINSIGFCFFYSNKRKPFSLWVVLLSISSKTLLCDNSGTVAQSKQLKYHQKRKCYLYMRQYREVMRLQKGSSQFSFGANQQEFVRIKPLKVRHDVTKLDLTVSLLSLWCIDIDLSIQSMSLTLYMTQVHQQLHIRYKSWVPCKQISCLQLVHGFGQSSRDYSAIPPNWRDDLSWSLIQVSHGECTSIYVCISSYLKYIVNTIFFNNL